MAISQKPLDALELGQWFKLICGASYQDVSKIRNLSLVYSLAGADCIDVAAELAVVQAALAGIAAAQTIAAIDKPWLMVSFNDGQDPHFRKAWFELKRCPADCLRPCERVCPAHAILPISQMKEAQVDGLGVMADRCYGCGRCLPMCPLGIIEERSFKVAAGAIAPALLPHIDAIEIHTQIGRQAEFQVLWQQLAPYISQLKLIAISCPDGEPHTSAIVDYLAQLYQLMEPKPPQLLWQTDGRSMTGDIGKGTTLATIRLAQKVLNARLPGYVQLAGGTNDYTVAKLRSLNLLQERHPSPLEHTTYGINGIAYGSYARRLVDVGDSPLEDDPEKLWQQVSLAGELVSQIKPDAHPKIRYSQFLKHDLCGPHTSTATIPP
ncbi:4Fe-4S ferredoxin [Leptolyngbya cf. ectocarpi LEGE 11479]|uniref:4Fe-4S ferredoxin n=1 Tax=Leptolyngbya cf. ectocarpi LEGE 11479 TaxID=1828722 RepID=A0A928ZQ58_LEPEC|nr:LdpA C-terminal domain-containing domain [Leptolyngbya ectocarpi]MBE9065038.1 4Fe-4S ferredoxin [Leptolyngbya cf. ectocarpi LEGE 11479]